MARPSRAFEAIFESSDVDTRFAGEGGRAPWQAGQRLDARGFGSITNLSVALANDFGLAGCEIERAHKSLATNALFSAHSPLAGGTLWDGNDMGSKRENASRKMTRARSAVYGFTLWRRMESGAGQVIVVNDNEFSMADLCNVA